MTDPFAVLGLEPSMDLPRDELEQRYLEASRETHPDRAAASADETATLRRSAEVNDAYRALRDPWRRAEVIIAKADPSALDRKKDLCPVFLMEAMELAERVADAEPSEFSKLRQSIESRRDSYLQRLRSALAENRIDDAAVLLHESRYCRKALRDLEEREHPIG
ncbi:MAG: Fe-S protein assembly co-chaperone HscB [Planctomycetes bacterium]|nr:Fe-S protein assembly co-chaperone HscB [Planctomycetota bacterium]